MAQIPCIGPQIYAIISCIIHIEKYFRCLIHWKISKNTADCINWQKKKRLKKERVKTMKWLKHCVLGLCQFSGRTATVHAGNLLKHHKDQISFKTDLFLLSKLHKRKRGREKTQTCESINKKIIKKSAFTSWTADVILLFNIKWLFLL